MTAPAVPSRSPLLDLRDVDVHFPGAHGTVRAVDGISLTIARGETLGLVGESGCGKSTLGRTSVALQSATAGRILFEGTDLASLGHEELRQMRRRMQMVFQDPISSLNPRLQIGDTVAEPLRELKIVKRTQRPDRVRSLLDRVGLSVAIARRYPSELSGGQAQRVAIARALAVEPSLVVADEAVSALDVSVGAQILNLLDELRDEFDISYLFISHDLGVVEHVSDRVAVMYLGKVMETGSAAQVFSGAQHPYTVALLSATPTPDPAQRSGRERIILRGDPPSPVSPPSGCRFRTRCPIGPLAHPERTVCINSEPQLVETRPGQWSACHFSGELSSPVDRTNGKEPIPTLADPS